MTRLARVQRLHHAGAPSAGAPSGPARAVRRAPRLAATAVATWCALSIAAAPARATPACNPDRTSQPDYAALAFAQSSWRLRSVVPRTVVAGRLTRVPVFLGASERPLSDPTVVDLVSLAGMRLVHPYRRAFGWNTDPLASIPVRLEAGEAPVAIAVHETIAYRDTTSRSGFSTCRMTVFSDPIRVVGARRRAPGRGLRRAAGGASRAVAAPAQAAARAGAAAAPATAPAARARTATPPHIPLRALGFASTSAGATGWISPPTVGRPRRHASVTMTLVAALAAHPAWRVPATVSTVTVLFPRGATVNGRLFASCDPVGLARRSEDLDYCPPASRIGHGSVIGYIAGYVEPVKIDLYNARGGRALLLAFRGDYPVLIRTNVLAPIDALGPGDVHSYRLRLRVPSLLQQPIAQTFGSFRRLTAVAGATITTHRHGRPVRRGYIEASFCPIGARMPFEVRYAFADGTSAASTSQISCRRTG